MGVMDWLVTILAGWLLADLLTGAVHWWEDRYGDPDWPVLGPLVVDPNIEHHQRPTAFCKLGYLERNYTTLVPALLLAAAFWWLGWHVLLVAALVGSQVNEVHAWAHQRCSEPVRWLQHLGVLVSPRQHALHHRRPYDRHYCVVTGWLNPLLSGCGFWRGLEWLVAKGLGVSPRPDRELG